MENYAKLKIIGKVGGGIKISGSKNASLPCIAASILNKGKVILKNVPSIEDVNNMLVLLKNRNVKVEFNNNVLTIDSSKYEYSPLLENNVRKIRASYYLLGANIYKNEVVESLYPGGCSFQTRPIDMHLDVFKEMGCTVSEGDRLIIHNNGLHPICYTFRRKSLGATINALLALVQIKGKSILRNVSLEPEVDDCISLMNAMGGIVYRKNDDLIIQGGEMLHDASFEIMEDRIETGSYALLGAMLGRVLLLGVDMKKQEYLKILFEKLGIVYSYTSSLLCVEKVDLDKEVKICFDDYPSLPSDLKDMVTLLLLKNKKKSYIIDNVYSSRDGAGNELIKLGANITFKANEMVIHSFSPKSNVNLYPSCLRSSFALLIASLLSYNIKVYSYNIVKRGYENLKTKLRQINIDIEEY